MAKKPKLLWVKFEHDDAEDLLSYARKMGISRASLMRVVILDYLKILRTRKNLSILTHKK